MRVERKANEVEVGDKVFFPNSRRSVVVGEVFAMEGKVNLISDDRSAKWMMTSDATVAVETDEDSSGG